MQTLPDARKDALDLRMKGYKYQEMADMRNVSLNCIKSRVRNAIIAVKNKLNEAV